MSVALGTAVAADVVPSFTVLASGGSQTFGSDLDIVRNATAYGTADGTMNKFVVQTSVPVEIATPAVRAWQGVGLGTSATRQIDFAVMNASDTEVVSIGRAVKYMYIFFAAQRDTQFAVRLFDADKRPVQVTNPGTTFVSDTDWTLECVGNVLLFNRSEDTINNGDGRVFVKLAADTDVNLYVLAEAYKKPYIQAVVTYDDNAASPFSDVVAWSAYAPAFNASSSLAPAPAPAPASIFARHATAIVVIVVVVTVLVIAIIVAVFVLRSRSNVAPITPAAPVAPS